MESGDTSDCVADTKEVGVEINLEANWPTVPFVLQNPSAYFPLLALITDPPTRATFESSENESLYKMFIEYSLELGFLSESQRAYVDASLAMHRYSALIQAHFQYYESWLSADGFSDCGTVLVYSDGPTSRDIDTVLSSVNTAKKKTSGEPRLFPFDRVLGPNSVAPLVILYGDLISAEQFSAVHGPLSSSALEGKIRYVVRYKPPNASCSLSTTNEPLTGYGVALSLKTGAFPVIVLLGPLYNTRSPDRYDEVVQQVQLSEATKKKWGELTTGFNTGQAADKAIRWLGFRTSGHIMNSEDRFGCLVDVCLNLPRHSRALLGYKKWLPQIRNAHDNVQCGSLKPGQNLMLVNGAPAFSMEENVFELLDTIDTERRLVHRLASLGFQSVASARAFIESNVFDSVSLSTTNFDYSGPSDSDQGEDKEGGEEEKVVESISPIVWVNDVAFGDHCKQMSSDLPLHEPIDGVFGGISTTRHNAYSMVFALDMTDTQALHDFQLHDVLERVMYGVPMQVGIIPLGWTPEGVKAASHIYALAALDGDRSELSIEYLSLYMTDQQPELVFDQIAGAQGEAALKSPHVKDMLVKSKEWAKKVGLSSEPHKNRSLWLVNGQVIQLGKVIRREKTQILETDTDIMLRYIKPRNFDASSCLQDWLNGGDSLETPCDMSCMQYIDTSDMWTQLDHDLEEWLPVLSTTAVPEDVGERNNYYYTLWLFADMGREGSIDQVAELLRFVEYQNGCHNVRVNIIPTGGPKEGAPAEHRKCDIVIMHFNRMSFAEKKLALKALSGDRDASIEAHELYERLGLDFNLSSSELTATVSDALLSTLNPDLMQKSNVIVASGRVNTIEKSFLSLSDLSSLFNFERRRVDAILAASPIPVDSYQIADRLVSLYTTSFSRATGAPLVSQSCPRRVAVDWTGPNSSFTVGDPSVTDIHITAVIDPVSERGQEYVALLESLSRLPVSITIFLNPSRVNPDAFTFPWYRFYRGNFPVRPAFGKSNSRQVVRFDSLPQFELLSAALITPSSWMVVPSESEYDLDNIALESVDGAELKATYRLKHILVEGYATGHIDLTSSHFDSTRNLYSGGPELAVDLCQGADSRPVTDTLVTANMGYLQLKANPGFWTLRPKPVKSSQAYSLAGSDQVWVTKMSGVTLYPVFERNQATETVDVSRDFLSSSVPLSLSSEDVKHADINIFSVAKGDIYERFLGIMTSSVMKHTNHTVKFWFIEHLLSPSFKRFLPELAAHNGFDYQLVSYKWPKWLQTQRKNVQEVSGYEILFLDVLFPLSLDKVIFVDACQIVRTDLKKLVDEDLHGAPYGYVPMDDMSLKMEGYKFWFHGYWGRQLNGLDYHMRGLYVVDLNRFRQVFAGDILRHQCKQLCGELGNMLDLNYQGISDDAKNLTSLDQDLPNHVQHLVPIHSLSQDWLWNEVWSEEEYPERAKTIDLGNIYFKSFPDIQEARCLAPEWTDYDNEIAELRRQFESRNKAETGDVPEEIGDSTQEQ